MLLRLENFKICLTPNPTSTRAMFTSDFRRSYDFHMAIFSVVYSKQTAQLHVLDECQIIIYHSV